MITFFNFYNYDKNPIVEYCLSFYKDKQLLSLNDCLADILRLRYSRFCYENDYKSYIGDELRLYYASISDDFIYVDCDSLVKNINELKMNYACPTKNQVNEGSYFRANKNTQWIKHYLDVYENNEIGKKGNITVHNIFPFEIPTQKLDYVHFYTSCFNRFPKQDTIYYTKDYKKALDFNKPIWCFDDKEGVITNNRIFHTTDKLPFEIFKEQLRYSLDNTNLKFEEI